ncbi:MAG: spinster family MFS transporter [Chakrabartia sp.]
MPKGKSWRRTSPGLALAVLTAIGVIGFVDRIIMNVLVEPIKAEFRLSDFQIGLVNGLAFALLNVVLGLFVARLAERMRRLTLVAIGTFFWSLATAATGLAASFTQLLLARIGVGVGEAVGLPATSSLISDYFPPHKRASALSVVQLSPPLGAFLGAAGGSLIAQAYGWQMALFAAAVPGIILALIVHLFVEEPVRGQHDDVDPDDPVPSFGQVIRRYWVRRTMRHMLAGSAIASMVGFGINAFMASYFMRRFGFSLVEAGLVSGFVAALPASISIVGSGIIADRWGQTNRKSYALVPAMTLTLAAPLFLLAVSQSQPMFAVAFVGIAAFVQYCYLGPTFGTFQNLLHPRMRATSSAFNNIVYSLIGGGLGPVLLGALSDRFAKQGSDAGLELAYAMGTAALLYSWAAFHYWRAARYIEADLDQPIGLER